MRIPSIFAFWLRIYAVFLAVAFLLRLILLIFVPAYSQDQSHLLLVQSFLVGMHFDLAVASYAVAIPAVVSLIVYACKGHVTHSKYYLIVPYIMLVAMIWANLTDLFFWPYFQVRLNSSIFQWMDSPIMSLEIAYESYPVVKALLGIFLLSWITWKVFQRLTKFSFRQESRVGRRVLHIVIALPLLFLGIRGRVAIKSALRTSGAFFSNDNYANNLALNSLFTFLQSLGENDSQKTQHLINENEFKVLYEKWKQEEHPNAILESNVSPEPTKKNFVVILMESFSARAISALDPSYKDYNLTPHFNQMIEEGRIYTKFFSNSAHTGQGLFQVTTGLPNPPGRSMTKLAEGLKDYHSFGEQLKRRGYRTSFFTTHDAQFDNMLGFMKMNHFDEIYSEPDYPANALGATGVADGVELTYALGVFDRYHKDNKNFVSVILTGTNHGPWIIPEDAKIERFPETELNYQVWNAFRYADQALWDFYQAMQKKPYFKDTIFLFVADHGGGQQDGLQPASSFFYIPLLIIDGGKTIIPQAEKVEFSASQMDMAPTIMDLAGGKYEDHFMGRSLVKMQGDHWVPLTSQEYIAGIYGDFYFSNHPQMQLGTYLWKSGKNADKMSPFTYQEALQKIEFLQQLSYFKISGKLP